jgi:hypothetical protein
MNKEKRTANLWMQSLDSSPGHQITKFTSGPITGFHWFLDGGKYSIAQRGSDPMTMEQLLEAEQRAAEWIRKMRKIPPSSIENPPNASTA